MRILLFLLLIAFSADAQLAGTWKANDHGEQLNLILNADGTGELDDEPIKYIVKPGVITMTSLINSEVLTYNYVLNGNTLKVSGGDLEEALIFSKAASSTSSTKSDQSILGIWSGNNESMEFKSDGTCIYSGHSFPYTAAGGQIKLTSQQGVTVIPYTVRNGQLIINVNGQDFTYTKGAVKQAVVANGKKSIPQELVGKWCWANVTNSNSASTSADACITLSSDGTYTYYSERSMSVDNGATNSQSSDRGAWWVEGNRIYYDSPTRGQGSYLLEKRNHPKNVKDPMIVLDGEAYVSQTQKAPWK